MPTVKGLYAIVDVPHARGLPVDDVVGAVLAGGARCLQLRAKRADTRQRLSLARAMAPRCAAAGAALWINDDIEAALALGEAGSGVHLGVHLGQEDLAALDGAERARLRAAACGLGISTHDLEQVAAAAALAPDYVGFGPVFPTTGKQDPDPVVGLPALERACSHLADTSIDVVAIGGIDLERAPLCIDAGVAAVAVIGALLADDVAEIESRTRALDDACRIALVTRRPGATPGPG